MKRKIVGIGETVLDIVIKNSQPLAAVPGGSTFNAMISLGRTAARVIDDVEVYMLTQVGDDKVCDIVTSFMAANGVETAGVSRLEGVQTNISLAFLNEENNASYEFFRDSSAPAFRTSDIEFNKGDAVVFGSFFAVNPSTREQVLRIVKSARDAGATVYYDINFRRNHLADLPALRGAIEENCSLSTVVRGSSEDIGFVWGVNDPSYVYDNHMSSLCRNFICTKGAESTEVFSPKARCEFPVEKIRTVSTIGAGDNFNAGFVFGLMNAGIASSEGLTRDEWNMLVPLANRFSANVCQSIFNYVDEDFADKLSHAQLHV